MVDHSPVTPLAFPFPYFTITRAAAALLRGRKRRFSLDSCREIAALSPPLRVIGTEYLPASGPCLVTVNHYARPGFWAWWLAFAVSAVIPADIHWVITRELEFQGQKLRHFRRLLTRFAIQGLARVYGFTIMPPMPPDPGDVTRRALAIRHLFQHLIHNPTCFVGLAPEGMDMPGGVLGWPPPGSGRMMLHLTRLGMKVLPVGAYEENGVFTIRFGPAFLLHVQSDLSRSSADAFASRLVMQHIARLLPVHLQGEFLEV
jgi:hypothetical protein